MYTKKSEEVWISGVVKEDPVTQLKVGGFGMVFSQDYVIGTGRFYSPVTHNPPRHVALSEVDVKALGQALNLAMELEFKMITVHSESKFLRSLVNKFIPEWRENGWIKSDGTPITLNLE